MTHHYFLASLAAVAIASVVALIRAVRTAPEGFETDAGFTLGATPGGAHEATFLLSPRPARRPARRAALNPAVH